MAAVNFYRFASAIMELLEPKAQPQDLSEKAVEVAVPSDQIISSALVDKTKSLALQAEVATIVAPQTAEAEAKTVQTVAANLSQALALASDEKLAQVAEVIKQVAVETTPSVAVEQQTSLTQTIEQAKTVTSTAEASQVVQATVSALAAKTVEDIKDAKVELPAIIEAKTTEVVTTALTEKIQQKNAEAVESVDINESDNIELLKIEPEDFWLRYDEIDPSKIKYYGTMSYLYGYMTERSLLDYLDPKFDLTERLTSIGKVMDSASQNYTWESEIDRNIQQNSISQNDHLKENEQELREQNTQRQEQLLLQQRLEREKMAERIASERLKETI